MNRTHTHPHIQTHTYPTSTEKLSARREREENFQIKKSLFSRGQFYKDVKIRNEPSTSTADIAGVAGDCGEGSASIEHHQHIKSPHGAIFHKANEHIEP